MTNDEREPISSETTALWNMRVVLPDDCRRLARLMAAKHDMNVAQVVEIALRNLARQEGVSIPDASSPNLAWAS